jgi:hypothetical protein
MRIAFLPPAFELADISIDYDALADWSAILECALILGSIWELDKVIFIHVIFVFGFWVTVIKVL